MLYVFVLSPRELIFNIKWKCLRNFTEYYFSVYSNGISFHGFRFRTNKLQPIKHDLVNRNIRKTNNILFTRNF